MESNLGESTCNESIESVCFNTDVMEDYYIERGSERQERNRSSKRLSIALLIIENIRGFLSYLSSSPSPLPDETQTVVNTIYKKDNYLSLVGNTMASTVPFTQCSVDDVITNGIFETIGQDVIELFIQAHGVEEMKSRLRKVNMPYRLAMLSIVGSNMCGISSSCNDGFQKDYMLLTRDGREVTCPIYIPKIGADTHIDVTKDGVVTSVEISEQVSVDLLISAATAQLYNFCLKNDISFENTRSTMVNIQSDLYKKCGVIPDFADEIYPHTYTKLFQLIKPQNNKAYYYSPNPGEDTYTTSLGTGEYRQKIVPNYGVFVVTTSRPEDLSYTLSNTMSYTSSGPNGVLPGSSHGELCNTVDCITENLKLYNVLWDNANPSTTPIYWIETIDKRLQLFESLGIISQLTRHNLIIYWVTNMNLESPENYLTELILYFGIILGYCIEIIDPSCRCSTHNAREYKCFDLAFQRKKYVKKLNKSSYLFNKAANDLMGLNEYKACEVGWMDTSEYAYRKRVETWLSILNHTDVESMLKELIKSNVVCSDFAGVAKTIYYISKLKPKLTETVKPRRSVKSSKKTVRKATVQKPTRASKKRGSTIKPSIEENIVEEEIPESYGGSIRQRTRQPLKHKTRKTIRII